MVTNFASVAELSTERELANVTKETPSTEMTMTTMMAKMNKNIMEVKELILMMK